MTDDQKLNCLNCGILKARVKFCSKRCSTQNWEKENRRQKGYKKPETMFRIDSLGKKRIISIKNCNLCKKEFSGVKKETLCSDQCRRDNTKNIMKVWNKEGRTKESKEKFKLYQQKFWSDPKNTEKLRDARMAYYQRTKQLRFVYFKERRRNDIKFNLLCRLRSSLSNALKYYTSTGKIFKSSKYGIDYGACIEHLMKTKPIDISGYHIDHIKPLSVFDLSKPEEVKKAFSPTNLQWLPAQENIRKGGWKKWLKQQTH